MLGSVVRQMSMHSDQIEIDASLVRALVDAQFPQWRGLGLRPVHSSGTVNALFRLGEELAVRLPLRPSDPATLAQWINEEASAAREFTDITSVPTPQVVAVGTPQGAYPLPWSVQTWVPGADATTVDTGDNEELADDFVTLIGELRAADTRGRTFDGGGRGGDLATHDEWMDQCFATWPASPDVATLRHLWTSMRELPRLAAPDVMSHRDLIPGNVLVEGGRLVGVLDCGGLGPADPALDLIVAWHFFDRGPRERIRAALRCSDLEWARSRAWAFEQAVGAAWYYGGTNPAMYEMGVRTLARIAADEAPGPPARDQG